MALYHAVFECNPSFQLRLVKNIHRSVNKTGMWVTGTSPLTRLMSAEVKMYHSVISSTSAQCSSVLMVPADLKGMTSCK